MVQLRPRVMAFGWRLALQLLFGLAVGLAACSQARNGPPDSGPQGDAGPSDAGQPTLYVYGGVPGLAPSAFERSVTLRGRTSSPSSRARAPMETWGIGKSWRAGPTPMRISR